MVTNVYLKLRLLLDSFMRTICVIVSVGTFVEFWVVELKFKDYSYN